MSGWDNSDRKERLPPNWYTEIVPFVKKRDGGRCTWVLSKSKLRCPRPGTDVDHRIPGDDHHYENLQLLCAHHHGKKTAFEAHAAKRKKKASRYRAPEEHPGRVR